MEYNYVRHPIPVWIHDYLILKPGKIGKRVLASIRPSEIEEGRETEMKNLKVMLASVLLLLFSLSAPGLAEDTATVEERLLLMEREIQLLKERNTALEKEIERLHEHIDIFEEVASEAAAAEQHPGTDSRTDQTISRMTYENGLLVTPADSDFRLKMGGRITARFTGLESGHPSNSEFSLERARIYVNTTLLEHYDLRIQTELSEDPKLKDGYLNIDHIPWAELRIGQFRPPFTWENLQSHKYLDFVDRSIAINNIRNPSRDIGLMLHGTLCDDLLHYQLALLNGTGENKSDENDAKDVAARLVVEPFRAHDAGLLSKLHLGVSGTAGNQEKEFTDHSFKTTASTKFVNFAEDTMHKGDRVRFGTEILLPFGPASVKAEWTQMRLDDFTLDAIEEDLDFRAWYVSGSYFLTGEEKTLGRVSPLRPFNPSTDGWGAWELAARYSVFESEDDLFDRGLATGTEKAETFTIGLNWYLNYYLRVIFDYEHAEFEDDIVVDGENLDDEDAFLVQCQLEF
jgi:phosphate-selective porin OprO/OprP